MSFFNDLGKKISDTTHNVVEKTKTSTDTMRLNSLINDEERNIQAAYVAIGKKYVELHTNDAEPDFSESLASIAESQKKIEEYREQIRKNKHLLICQSCGAEIPEAVLFCTKCGADNPVGQRLAEERAAKEAAERAAREAALAAQQAAAAQAAAQQAAARQQMSPGSASFCTKCGKPRAAGAMFCTGCGTPFAQVQQPVQPVQPVQPTPAQPVVSPSTECTKPTESIAPAISEVQPMSEEKESAAPEKPVTETLVSASADTVVENTPAEESEKVISPEIAPTEEPKETISPEIAPAETGTPEVGTPADKICPVCGRSVPAQNRFCTNCGTKVDD